MRRIQVDDDDATRDPAHAEIFAALQHASEYEPAAPTAEPRRRAAQRRPGPDSNMGLAIYFNDRCPAPSWAHGMQLNSLKGLAAMCREMRDHGMDADKIRALMDLYFAQLGSRVPRSSYWLDFKGSRWRLLRVLDDAGAHRTGEDYTAWSAGQSGQDDARFAQGWTS
jgi:hypothetical protein